MRRAIGSCAAVAAIVAGSACGHSSSASSLSSPDAPRDASAPDVDAPTFTRVLVHAGAILGAPRDADAVAISGAVIAAIGKSGDLAARCAGSCVVMEVGGAFVSPGFHDAHVHLPIAAEDAEQAPVSGASVAPIQTALRAWSASHADATWILAQGVNLGAFATLPTKADLDVVDATRPIVVRDTTLHNVWVNTAALTAAGITSATTIPGGRIVHDASGEPTGVLYDYAAQAVIQKEPAISADVRRRTILAAQTTSLAAGYTATQGGPVTTDDANTYVDLDRAGALVQRTFLWAPLGGSDAVFQSWLDYAAGLPKTGNVHVVAFKGFVDGTLAARTAAMLAPYSDDPSTSGALVYAQSTLASLVTRANRAGYPVALHAVGDRAVRAALDAFQASAAALGKTPTNRIEHVNVVDPSDVPRFGALGVVASVQPTYMFSRSRATAIFLSRVGAARAPNTFAWRSLADGGATLAFGTDYPVGGLGEDPITGMFCAITRGFADGTTFEPAQAIDPEAALEAYTEAPARIIGWGDRLGRIAVGYQADLVLLADDPRRAAATTLVSNPIRGVVVAGVPLPLTSTGK